MNIGVIGCGSRASGVFNLMRKQESGIFLKAVADVNVEKVKSYLDRHEVDHSNTSFYADADQMLDNEQLDGVMIGTRCSLHTQMALKVLKKNLPLYLEKPVATGMEDLLKLKAAGEASKSPVVVSFPLRVTPLASMAKDIIMSGRLGTIEHVQAINNVPYGGVYYHTWYRDENETGGLFLQKATHDFDYINHIIGLKPVSICAMKSKQIFKGDKPAGLYCKDCPENDTCQEGPVLMPSRNPMEIENRMCSFAVDTGNEDSGSALIRYETGMHASYSQNFFARRGAAARGARFLGYKGTLEFDWYQNKLKVIMHHKTDCDETHTIDNQLLAGHGGGDAVLVRNFIGIIKGTEKSVAPLEAGLLSALMCLKARKSAENDTFEKIEW